MKSEHQQGATFDSSNYLIGNIRPSAARELYREAASLGAERIAFKAESALVFSSVKEDAIRDVLLEHSPHGYKHQRRENGRWRDVFMQSEPTGANETIKRISSGSLQGLTANGLSKVAQQRPEQFTVALIKYLRFATNRFGKEFNPRLLDSDIRILDKLPKDSSSPHLNYVSASIRLYADASRGGLADAIKRRSPEGVLNHVQRLADDPVGHYQTTEGKIAAQVMLGKLQSLTDRKKAAHHFQAALGMDENELIPHFYIDTGVATYFTSDQIDQNSSSGLSASVTSSITKMSANPPASENCIVISVDASFFRIYAPTFLYYAQQLPDIDYAIVICGTEEEASDLVRGGRALLGALDTLNHNGTGQNIHFYRVEVPDFVIEAKTFFACARFFFVPLLLQQYKSLTLLDADMTAVVDPREHIRRSSSYNFAAVGSSGYTSLSPWRRTLAGNVVVSRGDRSKEIVDDICEYLTHGLKLKSSWMLDQNAIAYGIERHPEIAVDLSASPRPFSQQSFRETWERNFRQSAV